MASLIVEPSQPRIRPVGKPLGATCPDCDHGTVHLAGYEKCTGRVPASRCYGDCAGCGGPAKCGTCKGTGEIPNLDAACTNCFDMAGEVVARTGADGLCDACRDAIGGAA